MTPPEQRRHADTLTRRSGALRASLGAARASAWALALTLLPSASGARAPAQDRPPRPNVVFLLTDDQAFDTLSAGGHPLVATPNLDRLTREGVHFVNACVTTALCSPSRASFYTGQYARTHGVVHNAIALQPDAVVFPELLRAAGWDTAFIGKWHIGGESKHELPGFDESSAYKSQGRYIDNVFRRDGQRVPTEGFVDDVATDFALEFIRREREQPFLLCVGYKSTHRPRTPAPRHTALFEGVTFEPPANFASLPPFPRRTEWAELSRRAGERVPDVPAEEWVSDYGPRWPMVLARKDHEGERDYLRLVTALDENLGRILEALDELGIADDTLVIYASDNGFLEDEHGISGKGTAYESSMRTVMLMRYPRLAARGPDPRLVLNVDVAPTVLELAGLPVPQHMQGRSLLPLLAGTPDTPWRTEVLYEFLSGYMYGGIPTTLAVRGERYKLITYPGYPCWTQLFDLREDPLEMHDLAPESEAASQLSSEPSELAAVRQHLERRLLELQAELEP